MTKKGEKVESTTVGLLDDFYGYKVSVDARNYIVDTGTHSWYYSSVEGLLGALYEKSLKKEFAKSDNGESDKVLDQMLAIEIKHATKFAKEIVRLEAAIVALKNTIELKNTMELKDADDC